MAVLYRKYRPQTFEDVLNQKFIIQTLKNQVKTGSIAHAYLFTGSRGVGKTSIARILAKAVNCENRGKRLEVSEDSGDACGVCNVCKAVEQGNFIDLVEIDAASNTSVENVRDLIEHVKFSPSIGKYKVFIIDEVHMLSKSAFNALLKTLEEPPAHAIFILATTEINKVPATIISRTQKFDFKALSQSDILSHLQKLCEQEKVNLATEVLELVAQNAEGSVRDALSLLDKVMTLGEGATVEECQQILGITDVALCENLLEYITLGQAQNIPDFFNSITEKGLDYTIFNRDFLEFLRKILVDKVTNGHIVLGLNENHSSKLKELGKKLSQPDIIFIIRLFLKSFKDLQNSPDPQVPLLIASIEAAMRKTAGQPVSGLASQRVSSSVNQPAVAPVAQKVEPPMIESKTTEDHQEIVEAVEGPAIEESTVTFTEIESLWSKVITKVKDVNGPLASLLKNSPLIGIEGGRIILHAKFNFDKQSLENPKNTALICTVVEKLTGKKIGVAARVMDKVEKVNISATEVIGEALKVFGGELID